MNPHMPRRMRRAPLRSLDETPFIHRSSSSQSGYTVLLALTFLVIVSMFGAHLFMGIRTDNTGTFRMWDRTLARSAGAAAYEWFDQARGKEPGGMLLTHRADGTTPIGSTECGYLRSEWLDSLGRWLPGGDVFRAADGRLARTSTGEHTLSGAFAESLFVRAWSPSPDRFNVEVEARINRRSTTRWLYEGELLGMGSYSFIGNGNIDAAFRRSGHIHGRMHVNGNLFLGPHEAEGDVMHYVSESITSTGGIYRYRSASSVHIDWKIGVMQADKAGFVSGVIHPWDVPTSDHLDTKGNVYINGILMERKGPNNSDDADNPDWSKIKGKWKGVVRDGVDSIRLPLQNFNPADFSARKGCAEVIYLRLDSLLTHAGPGIVSLDSVFNSAYGHYNGGNTPLRYESHGGWANGRSLTRFLNNRKLMENWRGGHEGGVWVPLVDINMGNLMLALAGRPAGLGVVLDGHSRTLKISNGTVLARDITVHTFGEVYVNGDFNVGRPTAGDLSFVGRRPQLVDASIKNAALLANRNRIWFLSHSWATAPYGDAGLKGFDNFRNRVPHRRGVNGDWNFTAVVAILGMGEPGTSEAMWLHSKSHGTWEALTPNLIEGRQPEWGSAPPAAAVRMWGTNVRYGNAVVDTSGAFGDGRDLFSGGRLLPFAGRIPPKYARSWNSYPMEINPYPLSPPGMDRVYVLKSVRQD